MTPMFAIEKQAILRFAFLISLFSIVTRGIWPISILYAQTQDQAKSSTLYNATVRHAWSHITVDGLLNESDWSETQPIGEIRQREPHPGKPASERTEVKLLFDDQYIYIGVMCFDSEPRRIIA